MLLSAETILLLEPLSPMVERYEAEFELLVGGQPVKLSGGLGVATYDVTLDLHYRVVRRSSGEPLVPSTTPQVLRIEPREFVLLSTLEQFHMPNSVAARVHDKSTLARLGLALQNTFIDPGFKGHLTLEASNHSSHPIRLHQGMPIAQIAFELVDRETPGYTGKYQHQPRGPVDAR